MTNLTDTKIGKRLAASQVNELMDIIKRLLGIAGYVNYDDDVIKLFAEIEEENKAVTRGDLNKIAQEREARLNKPSGNTSSTGDVREALDQIALAKSVVTEEKQKVFTDACNTNCFGLKVLQGKKNDYLLTWTTNAYEDREGETFTLKSLQEYVTANENNVDKGTYLFWHVPGSDFADIVAQAVTGKFLAEVGRFRKDNVGQAFKRFFLMFPDGHPEIAENGWGCSQGFVYQASDRKDGVYEWFDKKETTVLPLFEAANVFTLAEFGLGEKNMELSDKQKEAFEIIGQETGEQNLLQKILSIGKKRTQLLDDAGIASKQAKTKLEDGVEIPMRCYAYVPDEEKVSTWKLPFCNSETKKPTVARLGNAAAAIGPKGFMGNRVELPKADVAKVKAKLRSEYAKLGVAREDMPEGIKSMEVVVDELKARLVEKVKACSTDVREKMDSVLAEMEKAESDQVALVRQLSELIAQVENEEVRMALEKIVGAIQETLMPVEEEAEMEVETETEMPAEEEKSMTVESEVDEKVVASLVKSLQLDKLNELLAAQQKSIEENSEGLKAIADLVGAVEELVNKNKQLFERIEGLEGQVKDLSEKSVEVSEKTKELVKEDEVKIAEKQKRFTPFWGSSYQASKAAETVLSDDDAKQYNKPELPSAIAGMSKRIMGGK